MYCWYYCTVSYFLCGARVCVLKDWKTQKNVWFILPPRLLLLRFGQVSLDEARLMFWLEVQVLFEMSAVMTPSREDMSRVYDKFFLQGSGFYVHELADNGQVLCFVYMRVFEPSTSIWSCWTVLAPPFLFVCLFVFLPCFAFQPYGRARREGAGVLLSQ